MKKQIEIISGSQLRESFNEQNWEVLYPKLHAHTLYTLKNRYGITPSSKRIELAEMFLSEILCKILKEERKWNIKAYPDFYDFITSAIDSHINGYCKKQKNKKDVILNNDFIFDMSPSESLNKEDELALTDLREEVVKELKKLGADDYEELVFRCMSEEGIVKPKEIQKYLDIEPPSETNNILRRLRRKLEKVRQKL